MNKTGWLIELGQLCLGYRKTCQKHDWVTFTDPDSFLFETKEEAIKEAKDLLGTDWYKTYTVTEHVFISPEQK